MARKGRVPRKRGATVAALARLQRRVARDLVFAALAVAAELRAADAAHVAQAFMLDTYVATQTVVGGELGAALFTQLNR